MDTVWPPNDGSEQTYKQPQLLIQDKQGSQFGKPNITIHIPSHLTPKWNFLWQKHLSFSLQEETSASSNVVLGALLCGGLGEDKP